MGRSQQENDPNATSPPPPSYAAHSPPPPPQYPQQYPPATPPYAAAPKSPYHFPPHQQHPHPPPPIQPGQPHFQPASFPPQEPVQPAVPFPPGPEQCYQSPATYPPSGPQQFNQTPKPAVGFPYVARPAAPYPGVQSTLWSTGLFDCLDDPTNALITLFFPCVTFGQVAEILDDGQTSCATGAMMYGAVAFLLGVPWILSCTYRTKLRAKYGLMESPAPDWLTHCFCDYCAICQEYRELRNRGLDPGIGLYANRMLQAQQQQGAMAPPVNQTMR